jgi:Zn-dependent protease
MYYASPMRTINPGFGKPRFSRIELRDIALAITVLSVAFAFIYARGYGHLFSDDVVANYLSWLAVSMVLVVMSFMLHEFGHKFAAQRYGAWAEFRMWPAGLGLALVSGFFGFLFAAPGAVYIQGGIDDRANGKISLAGPAVNFGIAIAAILLWSVTVSPQNGLLSMVLFLLAYLNAFLGLFNMIPVPPFDGSKIFRWNAGVWIATAAVGAVILWFVWTQMYFWSF